jgi:streptogramin lyase
VGPDGDVWFTYAVNHGIGRITPGGQYTGFAPTIKPEDIAAGPDGNLWFTGAWGSIYRITTAGEYTLFPLHPAQSYPIGYSPPNPGLADIAAGPDGNLWFTESQTHLIGRMTPAGVITEFTIPTTNGAPFGIAAGPDGNVWFTESKGIKAGRFRVTTTDLGVAVSPQPATGTVGQGLTYTITVTNDGPAEATDVVLT